MRLLALELSSSRGSIAFTDAKNERFTAEFANDRKHSGLFFTNLERCVDECGAPERIVVGLGPGSYAGTRIAIAAAVGLSAATCAQLLGLPSICALRTSAPEYAVLGDARRQSFFFARVQQRQLTEAPDLWTERELQARLRALTIPIFTTEPLPSFPEAEVLQPSAGILAAMAGGAFPEITTTALEPIYLREPHITQPKAAR
jgi:tRNA threonylcarbamoyl adenosine modification protein YeaZ